VSPFYLSVVILGFDRDKRRAVVACEVQPPRAVAVSDSLFADQRVLRLADARLLDAGSVSGMMEVSGRLSIF